MSKVKSKLVEIIKNKPIPKKVGKKIVSHSQYTIYQNCPFQWYLRYVEKIKPFSSTIHTIFGTAMHETLQYYLSTMYNDSVKAADEINLDDYLAERFSAVYSEEKIKNNNIDFSSIDEFNEFYEDGIAILKWFKSHRKQFFSSKGIELLGIEIPLMQPVESNVNVYFTGYLDIVFHDTDLDKILIVDFKTSTRGWKDDREKKDEKKIDQILWYKKFFAAQYEISQDNIDIAFYILKRKIYENSDFPQPRIQVFRPAHGTMKMKKAAYNMNKFVSECFTKEGEFNENRIYLKTPSASACRFCPFNQDYATCDKKN